MVAGKSVRSEEAKNSRTSMHELAEAFMLVNGCRKGREQWALL
jgi:hypothetical protein